MYCMSVHAIKLHNWSVIDHEGNVFCIVCGDEKTKLTDLAECEEENNETCSTDKDNN